VKQFIKMQRHFHGWLVTYPASWENWDFKTMREKFFENSPCASGYNHARRFVKNLKAELNDVDNGGKTVQAIPYVSRVEMATDDHVFEVTVDVETTQSCIEDGEYVTNFENWLDRNDDQRISGWGKCSGRKLWQVSRKIQRQVYRLCKEKSIEVTA
jgi:hypothetical protein